MPEFPNAHFGSPGRDRKLNWRAAPVEPDPDDEEMLKSPDDVVGMLGFDPKEFSGGAGPAHAKIRQILNRK